MQTLSRTYEVNYSHIDNRGLARPSFLFHIMQDAATVHAESERLGSDQLQIVWVLSRMKVWLERPLLPYEQVRCETWCPGVRGVSWYRCFSFFVGETQIGGAQSMWVTLDPETHRILRPTAFPDAARYLHTEHGGLFDPLPKLSCDTVTLHHVHTVRYADLDGNDHVNNVRIVELLSDALDLQAETRYVSSLQVNYTAETAFGAQLALLCGTENGAAYVRGEVGGKPHFEALATLSPRK